MRRAYPFHPEVFDRLYEDWSSIDGFQRTRGVLKLMAKVVHRLWVDNNAEPLIMPGSLPPNDGETRNEMLYHLPQGWDPVIDGDIDGDHAEATEIDTQEPRFGSISACRRLARTIFLGSAPAMGNQQLRGLDAPRVLLGVIQPNQQPSVYKDALKRLSDRLHYLNTGNDRFWFDVRPNLRREMEDRKRRFNSKEHLLPEIERRLRNLIMGTTFAGVHVFTNSIDVPDDWKMHLVVLPPITSFSRAKEPAATKAALEILNSRGEQPRMQRNRLLFLAADAESTSRLDDLACSLLAWGSIIKSIEHEEIVLDNLQIRQARSSVVTAGDAVDRAIRETYKWLIAPLEEADGRTIKPLRWENFALNTGAPALNREIERVIAEHELLITDWAPIHLDKLLRDWFWKDDVTEISAQDVWQKTCQYLYVPRLKDSFVFSKAVREGAATRDFFGLAQGKRDGKYLAFSFGQPVMVHLESNILIEPSAAVEHESQVRSAEEAQRPKQNAETSSPGPGSSQSSTSTPAQTVPEKQMNRRFFGTVTLDPILAKKQFAEVVDEVVQQFTSRTGNTMLITVELHAQAQSGFDESLQRAVKENCSALKFTSAGFEPGE